MLPAWHPDQWCAAELLLKVRASLILIVLEACVVGDGGGGRPVECLGERPVLPEGIQPARSNGFWNRRVQDRSYLFDGVPDVERCAEEVCVATCRLGLVRTRALRLLVGAPPRLLIEIVRCGVVLVDSSSVDVEDVLENRVCVGSLTAMLW